VLFGPFGLRTGWRILLWLILTTAGTLLVYPVAVRLLGPQLVTPFLAALAGSTVAGMLMVRLVDRRSPGALGFPLEPAAARDSLVGLGIGAGLLGAAVVALVATGTARWLADTGTVPEYVAVLALSLAQFVIAAAAEEAVCRGYLFQSLTQGIGAWPAVLVTSALFAGAHLGNDHVDVIAIANIFLAGVMLAVVYLRTRSLWAATAVHAGWNWMMSAVLDFPVSGYQADTPLYDATELGADWWTGGAFGPEAGLAATLVVLAGTWWLTRTPLLRESARMRALRPLVDDVIGPAWPRRGTDQGSGIR
jgi:uncharacterized protein